jgi:hypothetical protein
MDDYSEKLLNLCRIRGINVTYESVSVKGEASGDTDESIRNFLSENARRGLYRFNSWDKLT